MPQFVVRKQGRLNYNSWSTRVLTVDLDNGIVMLSRKGVPLALGYHAMRSTKVQTWPHLNRKYVEEDFKSGAAKLTLRLTGTHGNCKAGRLPVRLPRWNSAGTQHDEAWVLRFMSFDDLEQALADIAQLPPPQQDLVVLDATQSSTDVPASPLSVLVSSAMPEQRRERERVGQDALPTHGDWNADVVERSLHQQHYNGTAIASV